MTINLDTLRKIAEAATPGPWEMREENPQMDGRNFTLRVRDQAGIRMSAHCYGLNGDPEFIATFDPPTVLHLLDLAASEAEYAELNPRLAAILQATANALKGEPEPLVTHSWHDLAEVAAELTTRLEQAEQDRVKLRNRLDAMRRQRDGYQNQIRKARTNQGENNE